jgi:hypothetical protein
MWLYDAGVRQRINARLAVTSKWHKASPQAGSHNAAPAPGIDVPWMVR